ncbi:MAG: hypothetical protein IH621_06190 [Krumholzibacteria bacterium]|nr:hypothetical protein [Candidatus Krumholzibacteria bacterium]
MTRLIHTIALAAGAVVLGTGLWQGWGLWATGRRLALAYLAFFFLGAALALAVRMVPLLEKPAGETAIPGRQRGRAKDQRPATDT